MRDFLKSSRRRLGAGWYWPLVLLALPACALQTGGIMVPNDNAFDPGTGDRSSAVMCDIPKVQLGGNSTMCATSTDVGTGLSDTTAAVSLADGTRNNVVIDQSPDAVAACGPLGRKTVFFDQFPNGTPVCLNCMQQIPAKFPDPTAVCVAKCKELVSMQDTAAPVDVNAYCTANARVSTNFAPNICFGKICSTSGTPLPNFADPRVQAEPVVWSTNPVEMIGTQVSGNSVTQISPTPPFTNTYADFQAGDASTQLITRGDAWVEFEANDNTVSQVIGVRESCTDIVNTCPDTDPSLNDIGFAIILNTDQHFYTIESNPTVSNSLAFGTYVAHQRFRLHVKDQHDGTASISYSVVTGPCVPGTPCNEMFFGQQKAPNPKYPLRIDASFREINGTLANVTLMRIKDK